MNPALPKSDDTRVCTDRGRVLASALPSHWSEGSLEGLKWLALGLMTLDHVNKYLLGERVDTWFALGRLAMPLFAFVLGYKLCHRGASARGFHGRLLVRLAVFGLAAEVPFVALGGLAWGWYPLNILMTWFVAVCVISLLERSTPRHTALAALVFVVGGAFVEFWWPGVAVCVAAWAYCKRPGVGSLAFWVGATAALYVINRNDWAMATIPVVLCASFLRAPISRTCWMFYVYYPTHMCVLWGVTRLATAL